jgi:hypothetical protein
MFRPVRLYLTPYGACADKFAHDCLHIAVLPECALSMPMLRCVAGLAERNSEVIVRLLPHASTRTQANMRYFDGRFRITNTASVLANMRAMPLRPKAGFALGFFG